jgi:diguanylate cyclase (GGDEF)-like protein
MENLDTLRALCSEFSVLLVDDEEEARQQVEAILTLLFSSVLTAKDGEEALQIYKNNHPDLIITDLTMPKMDGFALISAVRSINPAQKIVIMSAHTEADVIVKAIRNSVDGYILKPIEAEQIFDTFKKTVNAVKLEKENCLYRRSLEQRVGEQADQLIDQLEHDSLTGLPNKQKLQLDFNKEPFKQLILINIDNFHYINIAYGYEEGDKLLKRVAEFLQELTTEKIYRGNGDEYFITMRSDNPLQAKHLAEKIRKRVYAKRFELTFAHVRITFSMGIVPFEEEDEQIPYHKAKIAIAEMRKLHKNTIGHYHHNSETEKQQHQMHEWAQKTKLALDFDLLVPYYQPIVNVQTGKVDKYECLARILDRDSVVSPILFIEPSRIAGMLSDITRRIIDKTFLAFASSEFEFSINITDDDFKEEYLIDYLQQRCEQHGIEPSRVVLEVLENISNYDARHAMMQINRLKAMGFQIAIDDFGAESSNFSRVQELQIDYIKIDGSFIKNIDSNPNSLNIVKTIVYYAKNSGIKTVAEYVHNEKVFAIVRELGIDYAQGFYLSEPRETIGCRL